MARAQGELGFGRTVVLKVLHEHLAADEALVQRFLDEAKVASLLVHPNVVTVLDVMKEKETGAVFLVLEYVHGSSLAQLLDDVTERRKTVPLPIAAAVVRDTLEGLHAAHEMVDEHGAPLHVVHRDVSPHNILVSRQGAAYLTDFGVAKLRGAVPVTKTGQVVGGRRATAAFAVSESNVDAVRSYIANQREHHRSRSFQDEFRQFLSRHGISYDERYVWD